MNNNNNDYDTYFKELGLSVLARNLNEYLGSNFPTDQHRSLLELLYNDFPDFKRKTYDFRAVKEKIFPKVLRNKFISACSTKEDVNLFVRKRSDKGYKYILISKEPIDCFDIASFVDFINNKYGLYLTGRYQDEKEVVFKFRKGNDWFTLEKIERIKQMGFTNSQKMS